MLKLKGNSIAKAAIRNIFRLVVFGCLGAALGYWLLSLIAPHPFSHKVEWLVSRPVLAVVGAVLGVIFSLRISLVTTVVYIGGLAGAITGRYVALTASILVGFLWYDLFHFEKPWDTFAFLGFIELLLWLLLSAIGALTSWLIVRILIHRS